MIKNGRKKRSRFWNIIKYCIIISHKCLLYSIIAGNFLKEKKKHLNWKCGWYNPMSAIPIDIISEKFSCESRIYPKKHFMSFMLCLKEKKKAKS